MLGIISKDQLEKTLAKAEEALNLIGYIPMISLISGFVRSLGGMLQFLLGFCFAVSYILLLGFSKSRNIKYFHHLKMSFSQAFHGICNVVRANIEAVPFLSLILCLPYDRILKKRIKYEFEYCPDIVVKAEEIH